MALTSEANRVVNIMNQASAKLQPSFQHRCKLRMLERASPGRQVSCFLYIISSNIVAMYARPELLTPRSSPTRYRCSSIRCFPNPCQVDDANGAFNDTQAHENLFCFICMRRRSRMARRLSRTHRWPELHFHCMPL